jgi:hypothetical protein
MECALTKGSRRDRSTESSRRDPRKSSLHPVAEPTRTMHPASSIFGKRFRAAFTVLVAAKSRLRKRGDADGRNVRTTVLPDGPIFLLPAMERILVGPFSPF